MELGGVFPHSRPAVKCVRVVESAHPYLPASDSETLLHFPGAPYITLTFDSRCDTLPSDCVTIWRDENKAETVGPLKRLCGGSLRSGSSSQSGPSDWYGLLTVSRELPCCQVRCCLVSYAPAAVL